MIVFYTVFWLRNGPEWLWLKVGNRDVRVGTEDGFDRHTTKVH